MKNLGEKKRQKQKKTKGQDMKSTHLLSGCQLDLFCCGTGDFFGDV